MITVAGLKDKAVHHYRDYLKYLIAKETRTAIPDAAPFFPLTIRCETGKPSDNIAVRATELTPLYENSKNKTGHGYSLELEKINTRNNATQTIIKKVYFESATDFLTFIGKKPETVRLKETLAQLLLQPLPLHNVLRNWAEKHIGELTAIHEKGFWQDICNCVQWLRDHPNSNLYTREVPLAVHTKFIENNRPLIHSLLTEYPVRETFEADHGLKAKPLFVRFRTLSLETPLTIGTNTPAELLLQLADFAQLQQTGFLESIHHILIVENEMVYLTFPHCPATLCIWGHGYTVKTLVSCPWLINFPITYFGDLDEHGFDILSLFRSLFPQTESFCMDSETLTAFDKYRVKGETLPGSAIPANLTGQEAEVFLKLRAAPDRNRLEQERIPVEYIRKKIKQ